MKLCPKVLTFILLSIKAQREGVFLDGSLESPEVEINLIDLHH
jgi:hypothetical protein